jgi:hypothetical protein
MRDYMGEHADWLAGLMRIAQAGGELDSALSPDALAHFCLLIAMGSALVTPDMHAVDDGEWMELLSRVVTALGPTDCTAGTPDYPTPELGTAQRRRAQPDGAKRGETQ